LLGAEAGEVRFAPATGFTARGRSAALADLAPAMHAAGAAAQARPAWCGRGEFDPPSFAFSNGVHVAQVAVDLDTGMVRVERYSAVDDVGTVVNPAIVEGQLHGGVAQGLGQALKEACAYDPQSGQLLTGSFLDYGMPRAGDMRAEFEIETDQSQPFTGNPLGAKGAGEAGTIAAPAAIVSAVLDALRRHGVTDLEMPLTPARVWAALNKA
jgi:carbon-monoxide dehydrogenase large subunit